MQNILFHFVAIIERLLRLFGLDVFTTLDDSGAGFWSLHRIDHGPAGVEVWGFGLHLVVSRLRVHPQSS
ncbi:MAG: hypothetical protein ABL916_17200 [Burkholderiaceae bacterium]